MSAQQLSLLNRLAAAWDTSPSLRFGQLVESVENAGWDLFERQSLQRAYSPRLCQMADDLFGAALDLWLMDPAARKVVAL